MVSDVTQVSHKLALVVTDTLKVMVAPVVATALNIDKLMGVTFVPPPI